MDRKRILPRLLNDEVEAYLKENDVIIVPVGVTEMHGGFPLDCETVISEAIALKMAEACDGLILTGLPYFYAGATASGRGTIQVSIRQGIDYLGAIAQDLLRQGFKRQIYLSFHGPAHMTLGPMARDFFDRTGVSILHFDCMVHLQRKCGDLLAKHGMDIIHLISLGAYEIFGRLEDVPLTDKYAAQQPASYAAFQELMGVAYQSSALGYCFRDASDHMATPALVSEDQRKKMALVGVEIIEQFVARMDMKGILSQMTEVAAYNRKTRALHPNMPGGSGGV